MKNIRLIVIVLLTIIFTGCVGPFKREENFSFEGLRVDLTDATSVGIGIASEGKVEEKRTGFLSVPTAKAANNNHNSLIKVNESGEVEKVKYTDEEGNEVTVPHTAYHIDTAGAFTFVMYTDGTNEITEELTSHEVHTFRELHRPTQNDLMFFEYIGLLSTSEHVEFILIHNDSGNVFNLDEIFQMNDTSYFQVENAFVYAETIMMMSHGPQVLTQLHYDEHQQVLESRVFNTEANIRPYYNFPNFDTLVKHNEQYKLFANDFETIIPFELEMCSVYPDIYYDDDSYENACNVYPNLSFEILYATSFKDTTTMIINTELGMSLIKLEEDLTIVNSTVLNEQDVENLDMSPQVKKYRINNNLYYVGDTKVYEFNLETLEITLFNTDMAINFYHLEGNKLYLFGRKQIKSFNLESKTLRSIEENIMEGQYLMDEFDGENLKYKTESGFTVNEKYLNLISGEVYLGEEHKPKTTITTLKPLN